MAKQQAGEKDPEKVIESALNKTEEFFQRNSGNLTVALIVIVAIVGGYFGYKYLFAQPRAEKAADMMFVAQQQFAIDSFALALNGDGNNAGFLDVIRKYGSTPQGNIAQHYAGICFLHMGDLTSAAEHLHKYRATPGVPNRLLNAQNFGLQADILVEEEKYKEAVNLYRKAVDAADNVMTTPYFLKKLGWVYEQLGEYTDALAAYRRIEENYSSSVEARDIAKFIGRAEQK